MTTSCSYHDTEPDSAATLQYAVVKRSVMIGGRKTSVSLEDAFWDSLKEIATRHGVTLAAQLTSIDTQRKTDNLSSAIRLFVLDYFRTRAVSLVMIGESRPQVPAAVPPQRFNAVAWR
ncbi:MAG: ribbon-helix-helix domain-containing protein [Xanthobacteraceae bacterium]